MSGIDAGGARHTPLPWLLAGLVVVAGALWLWLDGRSLICACGRIDLFSGPGDPDGSSQHLTDLYTPSHIIHGLAFYLGAWLLFRRQSIGWRLLAATVVEVGWEIVENSEMVIERYRQSTISVDYNGDTVINSTFDVFAMMLGFALARILPVWASVTLAVGFELLTAWLIRDGLILNVVMLLWPIDAVLRWQAGG